jgi:hypothetical protein
VVSNGSIGYYNLYNAAGKKEVSKKSLDIKADEEETSKTVVFTCDNLVPNSSYKLEIIVKNASNDELKEELTFITEQDYPKSNIKIILEYENLPAPDQIFNLKFMGNTDFGYWAEKGCGYDLYSIINGKKCKKKTVSKLSEETFLLNKHELFKDTNVKLGDIIQIGVDVWVKTEDEKVIFEDNFINNSDFTCKTSNSICLLNKSLEMYLNK